MRAHDLKSWLIRFLALWILGFLAAGIPLSVMGMMFGVGSYTLGAVILAFLFNMWSPLDNLRQLIVTYLVLAVISGLFIGIIVGAGWSYFMETDTISPSPKKEWIKRFIAIWILLILCAGIPFGPLSMFAGLGSVSVTSAILASLVKAWQPQEQKKILLWLYASLLAINILLLFIPF